MRRAPGPPAAPRLRPLGQGAELGGRGASAAALAQPSGEAGEACEEKAAVTLANQFREKKPTRNDTREEGLD